VPRVLPPEKSSTRGLSRFDRMLLERRLSEPIECVLSPVFRDARAEEYMFGPVPGADSASANDDSGADLLAPVLGQPMPPSREQFVFLRFNYCRYRAMHVLRENRGRQLRLEAVRELLRWERLTHETRSEIVRSNLPLVLAMAKRTRITGVDHADMISEGNLALLRSVDKFDCARGFKFSTYACRAILKSFSRVASRTARYRGYFPTEFDPMLEKSDFLDHKRVLVEQDCVSELQSILGQNRANLNEVEEQVIRARFALDSVPKEARARTLEQVGDMIGVTKERVRQIQNKALDKLRNVLQESMLPV